MHRCINLEQAILRALGNIVAVHRPHQRFDDAIEFHPVDVLPA